ncbi:phosphatase IMPL1, chloroplastic-like [Papaver somniferum]|uniref:phosphatase IMPL1, chloroplastic-like n=1 Tax=Papaver somniferum TaxID=3469 RepID=UPI000E6F5464|nr:phosphatase IMPL1, chloroplastic-like [Papaver somniferum]
MASLGLQFSIELLSRFISGGEAFCNGQTSHVSETDRVDRSLLVTEFGYEHDDAWATNIYLNNLLISAGSCVLNANAGIT